MLGLAGAVAQGLFRNPLADPYLLGSATGAALGVAVLLVAIGISPVAASGWAAHLGLTGAAFAGAVLAVLVTLGLASGVQHTLRLLLAGVIVGMVFGAFVGAGDVLGARHHAGHAGLHARHHRLPGLGQRGPAGGACSALCLVAAIAFSRALDALSLGETTAMSLGVPLVRVRVVAGRACWRWPPARRWRRSG